MVHPMWTLIGTFFVMTFCIMNIHAQDSHQDETKRRLLESGEILISIDKHPITNVYLPTGQCLIEASVEDIWWIITDFDSFSEFLRWSLTFYTILHKPIYLL